MFTVKKYFFIVILCFLTTLLSSRYLWSKEELKKTPSDQQKSVIKQKHLPTLTIKGAKIKTVPAKRASELQKVESKQEQAPTENQPQISLDSNHYDLGEVWEGDEIAHTFTVKNTGTAQLNIKNVGAGWGCIVANFDKAIPPGQEGKVTLKINTQNRKGKLRQSATILSNDPRKPTTKISITGFIKQYISVEPSIRVILQGHYGDKIKKKVAITSLEEQPLKITDITTDIEDRIKYKLKTKKKGKEYSLEIKTRSGIKESFQGKVVLKTNIQKKPELQLFVIGKLQKDLKVSPQYLYFGIIDTSKEVIDPKSFKRTIMVSRVRKGGLSIEKIESSSNWITTEIETHKKGEKYSVFITLDKDKLAKGKFREKVIIHTKFNKKSETATIIIDGKVI